MMDVKPWEPVEGWHIPTDKNPLEYQKGLSWTWSRNSCRKTENVGLTRVTLANGQRIIVRALSEDRKAARAARAARAAMKEVNR